MNLKHFAVVTAGVYVGYTLIAPIVVPMLPALPMNLGLFGAIALGVVLVDKFI
jgi:hypothetical protein